MFKNSTKSHKLKQRIEATLFVSNNPLTIEKLQHLLKAELSVDQPMSKQGITKQVIDKAVIKDCIVELIADYQSRGVELVEVASGFRFQSKAEFSSLLTGLFQEKAPKYSQALLETLALVAYKQPITRGEIEAIRGVAVSSQIIKTLLEHGWLKVLGQKEVPGRPSIYGTTKEFLDYFSLKSLSQLPLLTVSSELTLANTVDNSDNKL